MLPACGDDDIDISDIKGITKLAPEDTIIFSHIDLNQVRQNRDLAYIHEQWQQQLPYSLRRMSPGLNLDLDDIHYCGELETVSDRVGIVAGNFNTQDIRDGLAVNEYSQGSYRGIETWTGTEDNIAINENIIIIGIEKDVKSVIDIMVSESISVYEKNEDIRDMTDNLPSGFLTLMELIISDNADDHTNVVHAFSFSPKNAEKVEVRTILKFRDVEAADSFIKEHPKYSYPDFPGGDEYAERTDEMDIEDGGMLW
jgi:hypothetical protein